MVHKLWILDPKIKINSPFQTTNLWSEFQTWFLNSMMLKSCLACFKDSKKPPHMEAPKSWGWLYPQCAVLSGLGVWFLLWVQEGPGSNHGWAQFFLIIFVLFFDRYWTFFYWFDKIHWNRYVFYTYKNMGNHFLKAYTCGSDLKSSKISKIAKNFAFHESF